MNQQTGVSERGSDAPTAEALLGVLVAPDPVADQVFARLRDPAAFGGACGPTQVDRRDPRFDPGRYWRGGSWPQLTYLFWVAAQRSARADDAAWLRDAAIRGAVTSGFAEYWDPDSGEGWGAVPQSWTGLVAVMAKGEEPRDRPVVARR